MIKVMTKDGMLYYQQKIKQLFALKADVPTKTSQLDNDSSFQVGAPNYSSIIDAPKNVSAFNNDAGYQTATQVQAIVDASDHLERKVVESLPPIESASDKIIYMVLKDNAVDGDVYNEYMLINGVFEKIGSSATDLSGYLKTADIVEITNAEIDTIVAS